MPHAADKRCRDHSQTPLGKRRIGAGHNPAVTSPNSKQALQPRNSETSRPRGFVLHRGRDAASYPLDSQGFATLATRVESLLRHRARPGLFTRSALRHPVSGPNSLSSHYLAPAGLTGVGFSLSVPTYRGWLRRGEAIEIETAAALSYAISSCLHLRLPLPAGRTPTFVPMR